MNTSHPSAAMSWARALKLSLEAELGPPWMLSTSGYEPDGEKLAGRTSTPSSAAPSGPVQVTRSIAPNATLSAQALKLVNRLGFAAGVSITYSSGGRLTLVATK